MDVNKIAAGISTNSTVSLSLIGLAIAGGWGILMFVVPKVTMISTNNVEIKAQDERVTKLESAQDKYHEYFLKISAALSEIKGELKGMNKEKK